MASAITECTEALSEVDTNHWEAAFQLAEEALRELEVPVGCVLVYFDQHGEKGEIVGKGKNATNRLRNPTKHAEFVALDEAKHWCNERGRTLVEVMEKCTLYVTLEPCIMCASALYQLKIRRIIFGACNPRFGGLQTVASNTQYGYEHEVEILPEIEAERSIELLKKFYETENPNAPEEKRKMKPGKHRASPPSEKK